MITHYGLFWSERDVFWGKQGKGNTGQLLGRERTLLGRRGAPTAEERESQKDYREYVGLYCLYGDGALLYVGEAGLDTERSLFARLKAHRSGPMAGRRDHFSWFGRANCGGQCDVKTALGQLEAAAIAIINPGFNRQSGTFANAVQVFQLPHEEAEGDIETKLDRLSELVSNLKRQTDL